MFLAMIFLSLGRCFFLLWNLDLFPNFPLHVFYYGLRFDWAIATGLMIPFTMLHVFGHAIKNKCFKLLKLFFFVMPLYFIISAQIFDSEYFRFTGKRSTWDVMSFLFSENLLAINLAFFKDYWYFYFFALLYIIGLIKIFYRLERSQIFTPIWNYIGQVSLGILFFLAWGLFFFAGIRGGVQLRPIDLVNAGGYTTSAYIPLVLNSPFTIIKTYGQDVLPNHEFFSREEADSIFSLKRDVYQSHLPENRKNVILIILESFNREYFTKYGYHQGLTPFLDSIMDNSLVLDSCFANGKRSIEAMPCIFSGFPALMNQALVTSTYATNSMESLPQRLAELNYKSAFFHGGTNGTMNFDAFAKSIGFDHYYGRKEFDDESKFDGTWGIYDEDFLQYAAREIDEMEKPCLVGIFTLSSHHPFSIPDDLKGRFPPTENPIEATISYTDYSVKRFFESIRNKPWFENSLFVFTADHTYQSKVPYFNSNIGKYAIPLFFYAPNDSSLIGERSHLAQQTDIMPSVLAYVNYPAAFQSFGNNLLDTLSDFYSISYLNQFYQLIKDSVVLSSNFEKSYLYHNSGKSISKTDSLYFENYLKSIVQQYNAVLNENSFRMYTSNQQNDESDD